MNLAELAINVGSRDEFIAFVVALGENSAAHPDEWQNKTIESYLEALSAWISDMDGYYEGKRQPVPTTPSWQGLAEMLLAAKYYE